MIGGHNSALACDWSRHEGECWLHYSCDTWDSRDCEEGCVSGPQYPDIDDCSMPEQ